MSEEAAAVEVDDGDDLLEAGFNGDATPDLTVTPDQPEEAPTETQSAESDTQKTEAPVDEVISLKRSEYEDILAKVGSIDEVRSEAKRQLDTAFGKIGSLNQALSQLQQATPSGHSIDVTDDLVADLKDDFPELAQYQLAAFKKFAEKLKGTGAAAPASFNQEQINALVQDRLQQALPEIETALERKTEQRIVSKSHPDWQQVVATKEWGEWVSKQDDKIKEQLDTTWDSDFINAQLAKFKESQKPKEAQTNGRKDRLETAINPRSSGAATAPTRTEDDDFNAGFNYRK